MKLKWSALVTSASGKLGSMHCQNIQGVQSICRKTKPKRNITRSFPPFNSVYTRYNAYRAKLASSWHSLNNVQVKSWNSLASQIVVNSKSKISGFNLFVRCNSHLSQVNVSPLVIAPSSFFCKLLTLLSLTCDGAGNVIINCNPSSMPAGHSALVSCTFPVKPGCKPRPYQWRTIAALTPSAVFPVNLKTQFNNNITTSRPAGFMIFCRIKFVNRSSGCPSAWQFASCIII